MDTRAHARRLLPAANLWLAPVCSSDESSAMHEATNETDWEQLYQTGDMRWDKGEPSPGLVDFLATSAPLPPARVLVPGCGDRKSVV